MPGIKMNISELVIRKLIKNCPFEAQVIVSPTYIRIFFDSKDKENIVLLHKEAGDLAPTKVKSPRKKNYSSSDLELTGNPLESPFVSEDNESTLAGSPKNWLKEEESHLPVTLQEAQKILSLFSLCCNDNEDDTLPVWVVCDAKDPWRVVLQSTHVKEGWVSSTSVRSIGSMSLMQINNLTRVVKEQHLTISKMAESKLRENVTCNFDLYGDPRALSGLNTSLSANGSISLELTWANSPGFHPPSDDTSATLVMSVEIGHELSEALPLWRQLGLLQRYLDMATQGSYDSLASLPRYEDSPATMQLSAIKEASLSLLQDPDSVANLCRWTTGEDSGGHETKLTELSEAMRQVSLGGRVDQDFTDRLWLLLIRCSKITDLLECMKFLFKTVNNDNGVNPYIHSNNQTRMAQILRKLKKGNGEIPHLEPNESLEILIEMGLHKLTHDYMHVYIESELATVEQIKQGLPHPHKPFCLQDITNKLMFLSQLHTILEVILLAYNHLSPSRHILAHLTKQALAKYKTQNAVLLDRLRTRQVTTFHASVPTKEAISYITSKFTSWRLTLTSKNSRHKVKTCLLITQYPIFPSSVGDHADSSSVFDDGEDSEDELEHFQVYCLVTNSNYLPEA
uniref:Protein zwilch n=1 Tax=Timema douglasi TaxID=61478 RepID=A0A7R8VNB3_TIMDO|nr:unnamed protein product [Timema douglasi]